MILIGLFGKTISDSLTAISTLSIEPESLIMSSSSIPSDIFTNNEYGIRRLAVDPQQTSFEDNTQFRFVDEWGNVPFSTIIVYKVTIGVPINLFERKLSIHEGGRKYFVIPYTSDSEITGTLKAGWNRIPTPMNSNLKPTIATHPASNVTIQRYDATSVNFVESFIDLDMVLTDGNANRASGEYSSENIRAGYTATTIWLYLPSIPTTGQTNGYLRLVWEERY